MVSRVRRCVPVPHENEHAPHTLHSLTTQSTGHGAVLQLTLWLRAVHVLPPNAAYISMERDRTWLPPPQEALHAVKADQLDSTQSTGQDSVRHERDSAR